jgi:hypothetical protein
MAAVERGGEMEPKPTSPEWPSIKKDNLQTVLRRHELILKRLSREMVFWLVQT